MFSNTEKLMILVGSFCSGNTQSLFIPSQKISLSRLAATVAVAGTLNTAVTKDNDQKCAVLFRRN